MRSKEKDSKNKQYFKKVMQKMKKEILEKKQQKKNPKNFPPKENWTRVTSVSVR